MVYVKVLAVTTFLTPVPVAVKNFLTDSSPPTGLVNLFSVNVRFLPPSECRTFLATVVTLGSVYSTRIIRILVATPITRDAFLAAFPTGCIGASLWILPLVGVVTTLIAKRLPVNVRRVPFKLRVAPLAGYCYLSIADRLAVALLRAIVVLRPFGLVRRSLELLATGFASQCYRHGTTY
jgi:hypothetical protein